MNRTKERISHRNIVSISSFYKNTEIHCVLTEISTITNYLFLHCIVEKLSEKGAGLRRKTKMAYEPSLCFPNTSHCRLLFSSELTLDPNTTTMLSLPFSSNSGVRCLPVPSRGEACPDLTWHLLSAVQLARGGRHWAAATVCLAASAGCLTDAVLETGAACRISSLLQAAAGSIFSPPQLPWVGREGRRGGGSVSSGRVESQRVQTQWWGAAAAW